MTTFRHRVRRGTRYGVLLLIFATVSAWTQRAVLMPSTLTTTLPTGPSQIATVPLFNLWTIWWNSDRLLHGFRHYWHAPIFYPAAGTFTFSEPQPATLIVAPVILVTGSRVLAYKAYLLLSLTLNGFFAWRLLRRRGTPIWIAMTGSVMVILLPLVHQQSDVLQMMPLWGILWTWDALDRVCRQPSVGRAAVTGVAFGTTFLMSVHHGLFLCVLSIGPVLFLLRCRQSREMLKAAAAFLAVAAVIVLPLVWPMRQFLAKYDFTRTKSMVAALSAQPVDYVTLPANATARVGLAERRSGAGLLPGYLKSGLAVCGLLFGITRPRRRRWNLFLGATLILAVLLSLGSSLKLGSWQPWFTLCEFVPGLAQVRSVIRFAYFAQLIVALLAAAGLTKWWLLLQGRPSHRCSSQLMTAGRALVVGLAIISIAEVVPGQVLITKVPDVDRNQGWIRFVSTNVSPGRAVICLPSASGRKVADFQVTARWMYFGTFHGQPLVDGYSGFFPDQFFRLQDALNSAPEVRRHTVADLLAGANVELIVVDRDYYEVTDVLSGAADRFALQLCFSGENGIDVHRLLRRTGNSADIP